MLKDKIFTLVQEKFENELKEKLENTFENFEQNLEVNKKVESRDGFISFVDGNICLSSFISSSTLICSGSTPKYLESYINHIEKLAHEYASENSDNNEEIEGELYYDYISDDYFFVECNFYFYDKNEKGKGIDKIYFDYSIKDEYGKVLYLVNQKSIDEICVTDTEVNEENYIEVITNAIEKIIKFV